MRAIHVILAAIAAVLIAQPAAGQSIGDILRTVDSTRYNGCRYSSGAYRASCEANRVVGIARTLGSGEQRARQETGDRIEKRIRMTEALQRACNAGDAHSCQRVGSAGIPGQRIAAARALMDACRAGDRFSCDRAEAVLAGTDRSYAGHPFQEPAVRRASLDATGQGGRRLTANEARIGSCIVDIDPSTGMRMSGCKR